MIPVLVVGDEELSDIVDELGELGQEHDVVPYLAGDVDSAYDVYQEEGPRLTVTVLDKDQLDVYERLIDEGYRGEVLVIAPREEREEWKGKGVEFINGTTSAEILYDKIIDMLDY